MKKSFYLLFVLLAMLLSSTLYAQSWQWAVSSNGYTYDNAEAMCVDAAGNTYVAGEFYYNVTFTGIPALTSPDGDLYVAKFNPSGTALWVSKIVLSIPGQEICDIAINATGDCFVTGWFSGTATFGALPNITSAGGKDIFVAKYNGTNGTPVWAKQLGNSTDNVNSKITTDASGNSYVMGSIQIGSTANISIAPLASVNGNFYVVKLNTNGIAQWIRSINGDFFGTFDIRIDGNGGCNFFGTLQSGSLTTGTLTLTSTSGKTSAFLIKLLTTNGNVSWGRNTTIGNVYGTAMDVDASNNIVIGGSCETSAVFSGTTVNSSAGNGPAYLGKYDNAGNVLFIKQIPSTDEVADLETDCQSNIYICGDKVYAKKFNSIGTAIWTLNGNITPADYGRGGIGVDQSGNVYVAGSFQTTATFGSITLTATSLGQQTQAYVARISFVTPIVNNVTICTNRGTAALTVTNPLIDYIYNWYTSATGGISLYTGSSYTTPVLSATNTYTYYLEATSTTNCQTLSRIPCTVTVNKSCCAPFTMTMPTAQQSVGTNVNVDYYITFTNPGTSNITINNLTSIASIPDFIVTTISNTFPLIVIPGQSVTVQVKGYYENESSSFFAKCFSSTVGTCVYEVCQQTQPLTTTPIGGSANFTINNNIAPVNTTQPINFIGENLSGANSWSVRPIPGSFMQLAGIANTVSYAFPAPGNYEVQHTYGSNTLTKTITVIGENRAIAFSTLEVFVPTNSNYGVGNFTLEAYVKPTTLPTAANSKSCFLSNMSGTAGFEFGVNASGKLYLQIDGAIYANATGPSLVNGICYHAAVTRSGNNFTFYINGTSTGTFTTTAIPSYAKASLFMGRSAYSDGYSAGQFIGLMEDVRIWNVARTQSQISSNIYVTLVGNETGLLSYWPINEGSGTIIYDATGPYKVYANSGSLNGQTWTTLSCGSMREENNSTSPNYQKTSENVCVYPVPFTEETNLLFYSANNELVSIVITDLLGTVVYRANALNSNTTYTIGKEFSSGIYTVAIHCGQEIEYKKIVKQ